MYVGVNIDLDFAPNNLKSDFSIMAICHPFSYEVNFFLRISFFMFQANYVLSFLEKHSFTTNFVTVKERNDKEGKAVNYGYTLVESIVILRNWCMWRKYYVHGRVNQRGKDLW